MGIIYELNKYSNDKNENSSLHVAELLQRYSSIAGLTRVKKMYRLKVTASHKKEIA